MNLHEVLLTPTHLALSMEYVSGGSLTAYITSKFADNETTGGAIKGLYITEDEARYFFKQFISAVEYCHKVKLSGAAPRVGWTDNRPPQHFWKHGRTLGSPPCRWGSSRARPCSWGCYLNPYTLVRKPPLPHDFKKQTARQRPLPRSTT